jgi:hypothetical protein
MAKESETRGEREHEPKGGRPGPADHGRTGGMAPREKRLPSSPDPPMTPTRKAPAGAAYPCSFETLCRPRIRRRSLVANSLRFVRRAMLGYAVSP